MKVTIIVSILLLAIATVSPVWGADQAHHPEADGQPSAAVSQDKMDSRIMAMKESRMKMEMAPNQKERSALMLEHMQQMKDGMKMMDMMGDKDMMGKNMMGGAQGDMKKMMMESKMQRKMQMMMEMMRGMMSQQEMMMKENSN